ncbi:MAG: LD-carboxypeptidase [Deltaproteobacteria bacterium]|nr:LD-carboxypeptidase [Deltaproteobacteria bacterium]
MARLPKLRKPAPLSPGDVVWVVAPASPLTTEVLDAGVHFLREEWGLEVRMTPGLRARRSLYFAGTPEERAAELMAAFTDPDTKAILPVRGGYGLTSVLPLLDAAAIAAAAPKVVIGCSDLTALLNWLVQEAGQTSFHGPMLSSLGRGTDAAGHARMHRLLFKGGKPTPLRSAMKDAHDYCIAPGVAVGRAVGGSLSLVAATCGTPAQVDTRGSVLFLEDVGERPYRIDRLLVQIAQAGLLDAAEAVVFGDFVGCEEPGGAVSWRDAVQRVFRRRALPVLAGVPFGHQAPNLTFPLGTRVQVDASAGVVQFREAPLA